MSEPGASRSQDVGAGNDDGVVDGSETHRSRRRWLATLAAVGTGVVAGCSGGDDTDTETGSVQPSPSSPPAETAGTARTAQTATPDPALDVPESSLFDQSFPIVASGFLPDSPVTVTARATDENDIEWESSVTVTASDEGVVDLTEQAPDSGSYEGVHPMGLVWSMEPTELTPDKGFPLPITASFDLGLRAEADDTVTEASVRVHNADPDVTRHEVETDEVSGEWWKPPGERPHPPVVVLHGSGGSALSGIAATFASHGYAAFAVQYFGGRQTPRRLVEIPVEYVTDAIGWFLDQPEVQGSDVGLWGISRGGELALLVASVDERVAAVVSDSGSGYAFEGILSDEYDGSAWMIGGEPVPYVRYPDNPSELIETRSGSSIIREIYATAVEEASKERLAEAAIPVENADAPVLLLSGMDDQLWPATELSNVAISRLDDHGYDQPYEHLAYEDAGHAIGTPHAPQAWRPVGSGFQYVMGGTQNGQGKAAADAWPAVLETFDDALR